jgi:hypothetical protein
VLCVFLLLDYYFKTIVTNDKKYFVYFFIHYIAFKFMNMYINILKITCTKSSPLVILFSFYNLKYTKLSNGILITTVIIGLIGWFAS